jgi:hypothetical protein
MARRLPLVARPVDKSIFAIGSTRNRECARTQSLIIAARGQSLLLDRIDALRALCRHALGLADGSL